MASYKIAKLSVKNFRNLESDIIQFSPGLNCILGENGNGKTNLLEAVFYLTQKKSFRKNTKFPQIYSMEGDSSEITFSSHLESTEDFLNSSQNISYSGKVSGHSEMWYLDGKKEKKKLKISSILINPFDAFSFYENNSARRQWVNQYLAYLDEDFKKLQSKYEKLLSFRNQLIVTGERNKGYLESIENDIYELMAKIVPRKSQFTADINQFSEKIFQDIFAEDHVIQLVYQSPFQEKSATEIREICQKNQDFPSKPYRSSFYGLNKDEFALFFNGLDSKDYSSIGQQRASYLSLVFAFVELFRYKFRAYPIVLIDDLSGEFDKKRLLNLISFFQKKTFQVLITTANNNLRQLLEKTIGINKLYMVNGKINQIPQ